MTRRKQKFKRFTGAEIKRIRRFLNETQPQFANRFLCTPDYISSLETGRRTEHSGMFSVIMQQVESYVEEKREDQRRGRRRLQDSTPCLMV